MQKTIIAAMMPSAMPLTAQESSILQSETTRFFSKAIKHAPWFVQVAVFFLTPVLWLFLLPSLWLARGDGRAYPVACRKTVAFLGIWGGPIASLIQLYQYLCALFYFEHPMILVRYGQEAPELRQKRYREMRANVLAGEA